MTITEIAEVCHEANKLLCEAYGDYSQPKWVDAPKWQKDSSIEGVEFLSKNPNASDGLLHDVWMSSKIKDGWVYGEVKDPIKLTHPCIVPFEYLSEQDKAKDRLFAGIVRALIGLV